MPHVGPPFRHLNFESMDTGGVHLVLIVVP